MWKLTPWGRMMAFRDHHGIQVAGYYSLTEEQPTHSHDVYEAHYVVSGHGQVAVGDHLQGIKPGSFFQIAPRYPHWLIPSTDEAEQPLNVLTFFHPEPLAEGNP